MHSSIPLQHPLWLLHHLKASLWDSHTVTEVFQSPVPFPSPSIPEPYPSLSLPHICLSHHAFSPSYILLFSPTSQLDFHPFFPSFHFHCKPSWRVLLFIFLYVLCTTFLKRKWSFFFLYIQTEIEDCTENPCWQPISWEALISFKTSSKILNCSKSH